MNRYVSIFALGAACATASSAGCSPSASCDPAKCAAGNQCISDGAETKCRLVCALNADGSGGQRTCPNNYHCTEAPIPYCAPDKVQYGASDKGQWGAPCSPTGGFDPNPACDSGQYFWCYGRSPTDGAAFCTQYQCTADGDCRGGWWCATINKTPNVLSTARSVGETTTVCLPRTYCSPCGSDVDCPLSDGARQHCVNDAVGGKLCAPECGGDSNCHQEAACEARDEAGGAKVCVPRAGVCVGDGGLCSPCRSDADCKDGVCASSSYSTERFCVIANADGHRCSRDATNHLTGASCPPNEVTGNKTSCTVDATSWPDIPKNYCYGIVPFGPVDPELGQQYVPGCYTPKR
jgi:hypothetical protein